MMMIMMVSQVSFKDGDKVMNVIGELCDIIILLHTSWAQY